jgi:hypothetical protein
MLFVKHKVAWYGDTAKWPERSLAEAVDVEATAALKARVRAQAVRQHGAGYIKCRVCLNSWDAAQAESHVLVDGEPCSAEVTP